VNICETVAAINKETIYLAVSDDYWVRLRVWSETKLVPVDGVKIVVGSGLREDMQWWI
jgi:hypothetical protein